MSDTKQNFIVKYFSEFGVLRECGKNFWLTNFIQFFDGLSYFTLIIVFSLFLNKYCGFRDADAPYWVGMYTLFISLFVFAVGTICDIIGLRRTYLIGFTLLIGGRLILGMGTDFGPEVLQLSQDASRYFVMAGIGIMSFGTAFMSPCITTSIRRFTTLRSRPTGFNFYYLFMNVGALLAGFAIGSALGLLLGALLGLSRLADALLGPVIGALRAVPSLAWVPLLILWLKIGEDSKITLIAIGAFFPVFTTVSLALRHVDRNLVEAARAFGLNGLKLLRTVQLPAVVPAVFSGLRLALAQAWLFLVAAELIASSMGLGFLLIDSQNNGRTDRLLLAIVLLALIGKATDALLGLAEKGAVKKWA